MGVIADFAAYPRWASGVRGALVLGAGPDGRADRVRFTIDAGPVRDSYVLAYAWDDDAEVRWELAERGAMVAEMSGCYLLAEEDGATRVTYELRVGLSVPLPGMLKRRAEKTITDTALRGLGARVRALAGGR